MAAMSKRRENLNAALSRMCARMAKPGEPYWQSARALAVHLPKPLATMLRMTEQT